MISMPFVRRPLSAPPVHWQQRGASMKKDIHPKYVKGKVVCACGAEYEVYSVSERATIDICAQCHPFYTGRQKLVDTEGRVDRFRRRYGLKSE